MLPIRGIDVPLAEAKDSFKCWQADSRRTVGQGLLSLFFSKRIRSYLSFVCRGLRMDRLERVRPAAIRCFALGQGC
jgi:hypothetical protein